MSIYSILLKLLQPIPPENWTVDTPGGSGKLTASPRVVFVAESRPISVEFDFQMKSDGTHHSLKMQVGLDGRAAVEVDGTDKASGAGVIVGEALHWKHFPQPPVPTIIVKPHFDEGGHRVEYRFEGERPVV